MNQRLCYIQARGGSKRFPRKNLALWNGIPMLADAINKATDACLFDTIAVTSDDPEILRLAGNMGAIPIWRTPETSEDKATDTDVAKEVLRYFPNHSIVMKLYPCVPILTEYDIRGGFEYMVRTNADGIYSVDTTGVDAGAFYIFKMDAFYEYDTLALDKFPWKKYVLDVCQDINVPGDLEKARMKAGR